VITAAAFPAEHENDLLTNRTYINVHTLNARGGRIAGTLVLVAGDSGEFDLDGDVDWDDYKTFTLCFGGSDNPPADTCPEGVAADLDDDGDVDLIDWGGFQNAFTGPAS
jgi:hypothetical protein